MRGIGLAFPGLAATARADEGDRSVGALSSDSASEGRIDIGLIGGVRLRVDDLLIGAPPWSRASHTVVARKVVVTLSYVDLWRAGHGAPLHIASLDAASLDGHLERLADGRSSWQFGAALDASTQKRSWPTFGRLRVANGQVDLADAVIDSQLNARFSLADGSTPSSASAATPGPASLQLEGTGTYRTRPVTIEVKTHGLLAVPGKGASSLAYPISLRASVGALA